MLKKIILGLYMGLASLFTAQSGFIKDLSHLRGASLPPRAFYQEVLDADDGTIEPLTSAPPRSGGLISIEEKRQWSITCSSSEKGFPCTSLVDGSGRSFWKSKPDTSGNLNAMNHSITIDLKALQNVHAVIITPSADISMGGVIGHTIYLSENGRTWGDPVAFGSWFPDSKAKFAVFEPQRAQFVRFEAHSAKGPASFVNVVSFDVWTTASVSPKMPGLGIWGPTIDFPLVPVTAFVNPKNGKVVTFSSKQHDGMPDKERDHTTRTSTWNRSLSTGSQDAVSQLLVTNTGHEMFCPGTAFDVDGNLVVTGGESSNKTSIYDSHAEKWAPAAEMSIGRGYQGSVTSADGHIIVLGGSWSGSHDGNKSGEIYDPAAMTKKWSLLSGCSSDDLQTDDWAGPYRADNHIWLLPWKDNSIFHAGPSKHMSWISTSGRGSIRKVNDRLSDDDAMCGVAVMYDAIDGKILTAGGAPNYDYLNRDTKAQGKKASKNAFVITLGKPGGPVNVAKAGKDGKGMAFQRTFHHAVVLPNGEIFVVGGQIEGEPWTENTPQLVPEIYSPPPIDQWRKAAPHSTVRVYHSFGLLLPDATVLVGGGGLTDQFPKSNHLDAQIYTPSYLLTTDGKRATRPVIKNKADTVQKKPGDKITITTDSSIVAASLIRYGAATHSLNNDQRRIPLVPTKSTGSGFEYVVTIPKESGIAIPGYYMLFVMNAAGVPSESKTVQILLA